MRLALVVAVFVAFTSWSLTVVFSSGLLGFITLAGQEPWAAQMLVDLAISLTVAWLWLGNDAKSRGISPWPYIVATAALGSIGVLAYLIHRELVGRVSRLERSAL